MIISIVLFTFLIVKVVVSMLTISLLPKVIKSTSMYLVVKFNSLTKLFDMALTLAPLSRRAYVGLVCSFADMMTETIGRQTDLFSYAAPSQIF